MSECGSLHRFVRAQAGTYQQALSELRSGLKRTHWMWFVFPQIEGLAQSHTARLYAICDRAEGEAFARHELLGPRLTECTAAMLAWAGERSADQILGPIDAMKFASCMTLFDACADDPTLFAEAIDAFYNGERDKATLERL